jgi:indole-3-glycerol phosphate synthase
VDIETSIRLRKLVPENVIFVSESGIRTQEDIARLEAIGTDAVLIGETLMRSPDKKEELRKLKGMKI